MSDYVNDALLGASPYKSQQAESKALVSKWDKTGLLDGLNEDFQKSGMATMLENQAKQLISENSATGGGAGGGTAGTAGSEEWSGVALPLVRRIFGEIAAQDFVSVQPMNLPSGLVFYLDFKYGTATGAYGNSNAKGVGAGVNSIGGKTGPNTPSGSSAPYGVGGLYGEGRYDYSINMDTGNALTLGAIEIGAETGTAASTASVTYKDINFNQEFSSSLAASELVKVKFNAVTNNSKFDGKAVRAVQVNSGSENLLQHLPQFSSFDESSGVVTLIVSASSADLSAESLSVDLPTQPTEADRGDFEDTVGKADDGVELAIPEVDLQLKSSAIVAKTRKLKAVWSPELAQDLNA